MNRPRPRYPIAWLALGAIAGLLAAGGGAATACEAKEPDPGCCVAKPASECGCCTVTPVATPGAVAKPDPATTTVAPAVRLAAIPAGPCSCQGEAPAAPASKSDPRPIPPRGVDPWTVTATAHASASSRAPAPRLVATTASPPRTPLYLRVARILI